MLYITKPKGSLLGITAASAACRHPNHGGNHSVRQEYMLNLLIAELVNLLRAARVDKF